MEQTGEINYSYLEYDTPLEEITVSDLKPGDFLHLKTRNGSRYVFQVILSDGDKRIIRCTFGNPILVNSSGVVHNDVINVGQKLLFGKSQSEGIHNTSSLREIIVRSHGSPYIPEKIYGLEVQEVEASSLEIGDFINIKTNNSTYVFNVIGIDNATDQPILKIVGGNNKFVRMKGRLLCGVIEVGHSLRTETVDTSPIHEIVIKQHQGYSLPDAVNPFNEYEPSMPHMTVSNPDLSQRAASPYFVTEQEVIEALQLQPEEMTKATLETAWLFFRETFQDHLHTLGMVERIQEKLRFDRLKIGYKALLAKLPE